MTVSLVDAIRDDQLFGPWFKEPGTWSAWMSFLKALFALPMDKHEQNTYQRLTGRTRAPSHAAEEAWLIVGRRGGKSFISSLIAVYIACFRDYGRCLTPGERGVVMVLAADRRQARVVMRYVSALLKNVPMLAAMIAAERAEGVELTNGISIEIHTANFRSVRGYTVVAAIADEVAFWRSEDSANPDKEILDALRPAMATIQGAMLLGISSPYRKSGVLYEAYRDHFGRDDDPVLVFQADTRTMNPTIDEQTIESAYERDPESAAAEYGAQFRDDISGYLNSDWINAAANRGATELEPRSGVAYRAFADPSGGRSDSFTLAIGHIEGGRRIVDVCRARVPPFDPAAVVGEYSGILRRYGVSNVVGDRYAGEWVSSAFRKEGISYTAANKTKSEIYLEAEPLFATGAAQIPANRTLLAQLRQLERRTTRSGRDIIDHPPQSHDDLANAVCGVLWRLEPNEARPSIEFLGAPVQVTRGLSDPYRTNSGWF